MNKTNNFSQTLITILLAIAIVFAGVFAVTTSTLLQSIPCLLIGLACLVSALFEKKSVRLDSVFVLWLFSLLYFVIRAWLSPAKDLGISDLFLILSLNGVFYLNTYVLVKKSSQYVLLISVIIIGVFNALNFVPSVNQFRDSILPFASGDHQSGMYNHRNFCGNMMMMVSLLLTCFVIWGKMPKTLRVVSLLMVLGMCTALSLCSARGAYLGFVCGMLMIIGGKIFTLNLSRFKRPAVLGILMAAIVACVILWVGGSKLLDSRGTDISNSAEFEGRKKYFGMAIDQIPDAPLLGSGSMSYSYKSYENWGDFRLREMDHVWVHNEFLQSLTDYGLVGFLLLIACLATALAIFSKRLYLSMNEVGDTYSSKQAFQWGGFAIIIGFCMNAMVSFPAHCLPNVMVFGLALSWLVKPMRTSELVAGRLVNKCVLGSMAILTFLVSFKEVKALQVFSKHGIYVDNYNWEVAEHLDDGWLEALEEVVKVAPSHLRTSRLSGLLLEKASREENIDEKRAMVRRALEFSNSSLARHPDYSVSIGNKGQCLHELGEYEAASEWFDHLTEKTKYRQRSSLSYEKKSISLAMWAKELNIQGNKAKAETVYEDAFNTILNHHVKSKRGHMKILTLIAAERARFLIVNDVENLNLEMDEFFDDVYKGYIQRLKQLELLQPYGLVMSQYADKLFKTRQPELAFKWYERALGCYNNMKKDSLTEQKQVEQEKLLIKGKIQFLKSAKITPAK
jgi:O-antigen ligase